MNDEAIGRTSCTIQVNVTDRDLDVVRQTIPHHLQALAGFDRYIIAVNRYSVPADGGVALDRFLGELERDPRVDVREVDYSPEAIDWVSTNLFGGVEYPFLDWKGTPIHALVEPIRTMTTTHFIHFDCDMLIGGEATHWIDDAIAALADDDRATAASPLAGPPGGAEYLAGGEPLRINGAEARRVPGISQRICLLSLDTLFNTMAPIPLIEPARRSHRLRGRARSGQAAEYLERSMKARNVQLDRYRLDLLGRPNGAWSLHLPFKPPEVIDALPRIIERITVGDVPPGQRGDYNLNASMCAASRLPNRTDRLRGLWQDLKLMPDLIRR